jgi:hypothetical protein
MSTIVVKPLAGLANKLRVIESTLSLARQLNIKPHILWVTEWQMIARYDELFEPNELFTISYTDKYTYCRSSFSLKGIKKPVGKIINKLSGIDLMFNDVDIALNVSSGKWNIREMIGECNNVYINTCHNFYPYHYNFAWAKPLPKISKAIDSYLNIIKNNDCIGLHIRRTDNTASIAASTDELFEKAIRKEIEKNNNCVFFLATDDLKTQDHFVQMFGKERILFYPKKFGRDSVEAIQDAVVDWVLLGKCSKLYCSYYSSFSETAAAITNAEVVVVKA